MPSPLKASVSKINIKITFITKLMKLPPKLDVDEEMREASSRKDTTSMEVS